MTIPDKLKRGDKVSLLASSSPQVDEDIYLVKEAVSFLESWELDVCVQSGIHERHFYLAGSDRHRAEQLEKFYTDPEVKALFFTRGGYGSSRLYRYLNDDQIKNHKKIVVGYSDVSSLLLYFQKVCGIVVYHGPNLATSRMLKMDERTRSQASLYENLFCPGHYPQHAVSVTKPGYSRGLMVGANLTLVACTLGTPYEIETVERILFLEDVGKQPHHIDRMLTHMRNAGKFDGVRGVVFADMEGCHGTDGLLWKVLEDYFQDDPFPVVYGLPSGHGHHCVTLPLGTEVELNANKGYLRYMPPGEHLSV